VTENIAALPRHSASDRGLRPPALVIAFELERTPRALNVGDLTDDELVRVGDWIGSHTGWRTGLGGWLNRVLACREEEAA
jgi:hypothetical protein